MAVLQGLREELVFHRLQVIPLEIAEWHSLDYGVLIGLLFVCVSAFLLLLHFCNCERHKIPIKIPGSLIIS